MSSLLTANFLMNNLPNANASMAFKKNFYTAHEVYVLPSTAGANASGSKNEKILHFRKLMQLVAVPKKNAKPNPSNSTIQTRHTFSIELPCSGRLLRRTVSAAPKNDPAKTKIKISRPVA